MPGASYARVGASHQRPSGSGLDDFGGDAARTQQAHRLAFDLDDGRFQPDIGRAAVDDKRNLGAEIGFDRFGRRRGYAARGIGAGCGERAAETRYEVGAKTLRHAQRDRVEAGGDKRMDAGTLGQRQHQRQRARPESVGKLFGQRVENGELRSPSIMPETWAISGLKRGRPFASKMRATASPLVASPARP